MIDCNQRDTDKTWLALKEQVARLSQMQGFPREAPALRELVLALQCAGSLEQAVEVVSAIVDAATGESRCPMPSDIRRACYERQEPFRPDPECHACDGSGWRIVERCGLSGADKCECWARRAKPEYGAITRDPPRSGAGMRSMAEVAGGARGMP